MGENEPGTETPPETPPEEQPTLITDSGEQVTAYEKVSGTGYDRYEDDPANVQTTEEGFEAAELSAEEVPLEESRKNEYTLLATDKVSIGSDGEFVIEKMQ